MTEPFVPTGRELDEGIDNPPAERASLGRRVLKRLTHPRAGAPTRSISQIELHLDPSVGQRLKRKRGSTPVAGTEASHGTALPVQRLLPEQAVSPTQTERFRGRNLSPTSKPTALPSTRNRASRKKLSSEPSIDTEVIAALLVLAHTPDPVVAKVVDAWDPPTDVDPGTNELLGWWLNSDRPHVANAMLSSSTMARLPEAVGGVLEELVTRPEADGTLRHYRAQLALCEAADDAVSKLRRLARDYPSLVPVTDLLRAGQPEQADQYVRGTIGYDSAAWRAANVGINHAVACVRAAGELVGALPRCSLPRTLVGFSDVSEHLARAVASTVCSTASVRPLRGSSQQILATSRARLGSYGSARQKLLLAAFEHVHNEHPPQSRQR